MAFVGVFARGWVNLAYALLAAWGLLFWAAGSRLPRRPCPPLPRAWAWGAAIFAGTCLLASLAGGDPWRSLRHTGTMLYLLAAFPLTWLALSQKPETSRVLPTLWALGLAVSAVIVLRQAGWTLACIRAKSHLGVIELGAVLGQLTPVMVGALALALKKGDRRRVALHLASLAAAAVCLAVSCSRIGLIAAAALSALTLAVNWRSLSRRVRLAALLLAGAAALGTTLNDDVFVRFAEMTESQGNFSNDVRYSLWRHGWRSFLQHPILGAGPDAVPSPSPELLPRRHDGSLIQLGPYTGAHQIPATVLAESGLVGFLGFLALHLAPLWALGRRLRSPDPETFFWAWAAVAVAGQLALNGLIDQVFGLKPLMYIYWCVTATALWLPRQRAAEALRSSASAR
jgi:O-antigen ligase